MELIKSSDGSVILVTLNTYISELKALIFWTESIEDEKISFSTFAGNSDEPLFTEVKLSWRTLVLSNTKVLSFIAAIKSFVRSTKSKLAWSILNRSNTSSVTWSKGRTEGATTSDTEATKTSSSSSRISAKSLGKSIP